MYDSPKAAHFDAYRNGERLHDVDKIGLHGRWEAANLVRDRLGIRNMIGLSDEDENRIDDRLETLFVGTGISVRRRDDGNSKEADVGSGRSQGPRDRQDEIDAD